MKKRLHDRELKTLSEFAGAVNPSYRPGGSRDALQIQRFAA
jgi:hypothetical protein